MERLRPVFFAIGAPSQPGQSSAIGVASAEALLCNRVGKQVGRSSGEESTAGLPENARQTRRTAAASLCVLPAVIVPKTVWRGWV